MNNPLYNATVKADARKIQVYLTKKDEYCEWPECRVTHKKSDVIIENKIAEKK